MQCVRCQSPDTKVIDSRIVEGGKVVRRRRQCQRCGIRFTTHERITDQPVLVVKKDGRKELFNRQKIVLGMLKACEKRPVSLEQVEAIAQEIEWEIRQRGSRQVSSREIGEMVMNRLLQMDDVAYIRFASVYQEFDSLRHFAQALSELQRKKAPHRLSKRKGRKKGSR
ncbi:MAG: transcriptional regulator NrdR [Armatimonadetes bacterium]|nr:transcriptional regulator NrdR [Armatimonadota bacterium]MDW8120956.1 transcriptional regulator NrdR [Armatimonadota bacterium]